MKRITFLIALLTLAFSLSLRGAISPADRDSLVYHFNILRNGWVQSSADVCTAILGNPAYNAQDWEDFFGEYYASYGTSRDLQFYIQHPTYFWLTPSIRLNLQLGQKTPLVDAVDSLLATPVLSAYLDQNDPERESFFTLTDALAQLVNHPQSQVPAYDLNQMLQTVEGWISSYPGFLKRNGPPLDPGTLPYLALVRHRIHMVLVPASPLTPTRINYLVGLFQMEGMYRRLMERHHLYVADNNSMSAADLGFLDSLMATLPDAITQLSVICGKDYYYPSGPGVVQDVPVGSPYVSSVNTFSTIGAYPENQFPPDISPLYNDLFCSVVVHEVTHTFDPDYIYPNAQLSARRAQLIQQAGPTDSLQYLRSQVYDHDAAGDFRNAAAYFTQNPQEFLASIGNEYFCGTQHTLDLALYRFNWNKKEPVNQFLFFAEILSAGTDSTLFYRIDPQAHLQWQKVPLMRDGQGRIRRIILPDKWYDFALDETGNVTAYYYTNSNEDYAMRLEGNQDLGYARMPAPGIRSNTLTYMMWVKPERQDPNPAPNRSTLFWHNYSPDMANGALDFDITTGELFAEWEGGTGYYFVKPTHLYLQEDAWNHVALVISPDYLAVYLNGEETKFVVPPGYPPLDSLSLVNYIYLGSSYAWGSSTRYFKGEMDDFSLYDTVLTREQIREKMHLHPAPTDPHLISYFDMNSTFGFRNSAHQVKATAPLGDGMSYRVAHVNSSGNLSFGTTGLSMTFPSSGVYPNGEMVAFRLQGAPRDLPEKEFRNFSPDYWIVRSWGTNPVFDELTEISFQGIGTVTAEEVSDPSKISLLKRESNDHGAGWLAQAAGTASQAGSNGSVTFGTDNGITSFSQFLIARACPDNVVTTTADDGTGSLREVIRNACPGSTVTFDPALAGDTIFLSSGELLVDKNLNIQGFGMDKLFISAGLQHRIFRVDSLAAVEMRDLTLTSGNDPSNHGGNIHNQATLHLERVAVRSARGGGIYNAGTSSLTLCEVTDNYKLCSGPDGIGGAGILNEGGTIEMNSTLVADNEVVGWSYIGFNPYPNIYSRGFPSTGGGICNESGIVHIRSSAIVRNISRGGLDYNWYGVSMAHGMGGGIYHSAGFMEITNSTIAHNIGAGGGESVGGIKNNGYMEFRHNSVVFNNVPVTGTFGINTGISGLNNQGTLVFSGNIFAYNKTDGTNAYSDFANGYGANIFLRTEGYNLIGDEATRPKFPNAQQMLPSANDLVGGWENTMGVEQPLVDALLDTLAFNGGFTPTVALLTGSPALDAGNPSDTLLTDQRGYLRPAGLRADIGAYESGAEPLIRITDPLEGDSFFSLTDIPVTAEVAEAFPGAYLKVTCPDGAWRKLRMGNNPVSIWGPGVDVIAGGNDSLVLILRDPNENINWSKIRIHPNGVTQVPVNLQNYLPGGTVGNTWTRVVIPLHDFNPGINFSNLTFLEFPYSSQAGAFELHIQEVRFTGGTTPYLWFGADKTDNKHDGDGGLYKLLATVEGSASTYSIEKVNLLVNGCTAGEDAAPPFEFTLRGLGAGTYVLQAVASINDGAQYYSEPVNITVELPEVRIVQPADGDTFPTGHDLLIAAEVEDIEGGDFLQVICPDASYRKLRLGNNPYSIWGPGVNVIAGGNDSLVLVIRDPNADIDWNKVRLHPNGVTASPVNLLSYLPTGGVGKSWVRMAIPLAAFNTGINFTDMVFLEFPFSAQAGPFELHIREVLFTGGTTPYRWFGQDKTDNKHDGDGSSARMWASLQADAASLDFVQQVDFYAGSQWLGADTLPPYEVTWQNLPAGVYTLTAKALLQNGEQASSPPISIIVEPSAPRLSGPPVLPRMQVFPNPTFGTTILRIHSLEAERATLVVVNAEGRTLLRQTVELAEGKTNLILDFSGWTEGVYLLRVDLPNGKESMSSRILLLQ